MPLPVACKSCVKLLSLPEEYRGRKVRCPFCAVVFVAEEPVELQPVVDDRPARPAARPRWIRQQEPIDFRVQIRNDPLLALKGLFEARLTAEGLLLRKGKKQAFLVGPGGPARHITGNRVSLPIDGRWVEVAVVKIGWYQNRLAADLVEYLNGEREALYPEEYKVPWYLYAVAFLPLGIPILTVGGAIWGGLGGGLTAASLGIAQVEHLPAPVRLFLELGVAAIGYLILFLVVRGAAGW